MKLTRHVTHAARFVFTVGNLLYSCKINGTGTVWRKIGAAVWDGWVWYMGAVWEQYWSGGMGSGVKRYRYGRKVADDAVSDIFFKL